MIKLLDENTPFPSLNDGVFSLRQKAFFNSYGVKAPFFMTWVQTDENEDESAVITSLSGDVTLALSGRADFDEISGFLSAVGFSSVFFNKKYASRFAFENGESGKIMKLEKELPETEVFFDEPDYKAVFGLLFENGGVSFPDWFTDLSLRARKGFAYILTHKENGKTVACALCQATDEKSELIGSVKTDREFRNKGIGTFLVTKLCAFLQKENKTVFLCRDENKNEDFYSRIGFKNCGEWMSIKNE